jgi:hypothetical protein
MSDLAGILVSAALVPSACMRLRLIGLEILLIVIEICEYIYRHGCVQISLLFFCPLSRLVVGYLTFKSRKKFVREEH